MYLHFCQNIKQRYKKCSRGCQMQLCIGEWITKLKIRCYKCVDFKKNVGHETKWCQKNICKKCGQSGHTKMDCMVDIENFPLLNEILCIFRHLNQEDKNQWVCMQFWQVRFYLNDFCKRCLLIRNNQNKISDLPDSATFRGTIPLLCKFVSFFKLSQVESFNICKQILTQ